MNLTLEPRFTNIQHGVPSFWRRLRVTEGAYQPDDLLMISRTGELVKVQRATGQLLDVERGIGSIPCPIENGDEAFYVGHVEKPL